MTNEQIIKEAIAFAEEVINGPGNNPEFFKAWKAKQQQWKKALDIRLCKEIRLNKLELEILEEFRRLGVEAADISEAHGNPWGPDPWSIFSDKLFSQLQRWRN